MYTHKFETNFEQKNNIFITIFIDFCEYYIHFFINIYIVSLNYILLAYASRKRIHFYVDFYSFSE